MMLVRKEDGFITAAVLLLLFGLGLILSSVYRYGVVLKLRVEGESQRMMKGHSLHGGIEWFAAILSEDSSPGGNSWHDLTLPDEYVRRQGNQLLYRLEDGIELRVEEVSSRVNPNFDYLDFWRESFLAHRIVGLSSLALWERQRLDKGFLSSPEDFYWIPYPKDWNRYYSLYSPISVKTTPPELIDRYLSGLGWTGDSIAGFWRDLGSGSFTTRRLQELIARYGRAPALQTEAAWNVNMMDENLLSELIFFPWGTDGFLHPDWIRQWMLRARVEKEIDLHQLKKELASERRSVREAFLAKFGTHSWFWKLDLQTEGMALRAYLRRSPPLIQEDAMQLTRIQIISLREISEGKEN